MNLYKQHHFTKSHTFITLTQVHTLQKITSNRNCQLNESQTQALCNKYTRLKPTFNVVPFFSEKPRRAPRST